MGTQDEITKDRWRSMVRLGNFGFTDISYANSCGVYALVNWGVPVYIGQTVNGLRRIGDHVKDKVFDEVWFKRVPQAELREVEGWLIDMFRPKYNKLKPSRNKVVKIQTAKKIRARNEECEKIKKTQTLDDIREVLYMTGLLPKKAPLIRRA